MIFSFLLFAVNNFFTNILFLIGHYFYCENLIKKILRGLPRGYSFTIKILPIKGFYVLYIIDYQLNTGNSKFVKKKFHLATQKSMPICY